MKRTVIVFLLGFAGLLSAGDHRYMANVNLTADDFKVRISVADNRIVIAMKNTSTATYRLDLTTSYLQVPRSNWTSPLTDNFAGNPAQQASVFPPGITTATFYAASAITETDSSWHDVHFKWATGPCKFSLQFYGSDGVRKEYIFDGELLKNPPKTDSTFK